MRVHFLGIGGIGVSAVARVLLERGDAEVTGSDVRRSQLTDMIEERGARVVIGHAPENVEGADLVVISTAIPENNIELVRARELGIEIVHRSTLLGRMMEGRQTIGVTGTHGKGTVSTMTTWLLDQGGQAPGFIIGALPNNYGYNARDGKELMVVEVDESDGSHLNVKPTRVVCNFMELDHLNYYSGLDDIIGAMKRFILSNERLEALYVNGDCEGNQQMIASLREEGIRVPIVTYGMGEGCDVRAVLQGRGQFPTRFGVWRNGEFLGETELNLPGRYNVVNACGALAVAMDLGVDFPTISRALPQFLGLENRFTIVEAGGVYLVKDYISHPTGMRKVLESARDLVEGRLISVFKPYRYTLMKYLEDEYATAFEGSDEVVITTMYAAGEPPIEGVSTESFVANLRDAGFHVTHLPQQEDIHPWVLKNTRRGDKVLFFGGDDFFQMCDRIAVDLKDQPRPS